MRRRDFIRDASLAGGLALGAAPLLARDALGRELEIEDPEALTQALADEARHIFAANRVESRMGRFHLPSNSTYRRFYAWDSGWNIISQTAFDPAGAVDELEAIFNFQLETGLVPHEALVPEYPKEKDPTYQAFGDDLFDSEGRSRMIDPPSFLVAAEIAYRRTHDPRVLALLPKMEKCLDYLLGPRDLLGDGLIAIVHPWESGTDLAPAYDQPMGLNPLDPLAGAKGNVFFATTIARYAELGWDLAAIRDLNRFVVEDVGLNGLAAAGAQAVANLLAIAGQPDRADHWRRRAHDLIAAIERIMWDEDRGFFFPRWNAADPRRSFRTSLTGLVPLVTGLVAEDKAARVIDDYLLSPRHFWTPSLVAFNSRTELDREPPSLLHGHLWRGRCIWINMNFLAAAAAKAYGRDDAAREITRRTAAMIARHGFREYYRPRSGKGVGAHSFTWPALVLPMIEEHGL